jgi:hypothetical protein
MKHLMTILTLTILQSCATYPPGYEGAAWECPFGGSECIERYKQDVDALRAMTVEERLAWYHSQRAKNQAIRDLGRGIAAPMVDATKQIQSYQEPKQPKQEPQPQITVNQFIHQNPGLWVPPAYQEPQFRLFK